MPVGGGDDFLFAILGMASHFPDMSTVKEIKAAADQLSAHDRMELFHWLNASKEVKQFRREELRQEIAAGLEQADRGNVAQLNIQSIKEEIHRRRATKGD